jgi:hypothetical protein
LVAIGGNSGHAAHIVDRSKLTHSRHLSPNFAVVQK